MATPLAIHTNVPVGRHDLARLCDLGHPHCVLYEMLTGCRPFDGEDITDTIAAVVTKDPDWSRSPAPTPPAIGTLLRRCLERTRSGG